MQALPDPHLAHAATGSLDTAVPVPVLFVGVRDAVKILQRTCTQTKTVPRATRVEDMASVISHTARSIDVGRFDAKRSLRDLREAVC